MNKKLLTAAPLIQGGCSDNSAKLQRVGKTSGLTCLDNCLINSDIDFPPLSSQFKDIQLQLHATKVTNPYTFSIQGNKSFSGICELDKPSYVIAYGSEPWYYSNWPDASKVSDLTTINSGVKFNVKNAIDLENMFRNCSSLTSLDLSNFNTSNVTSMEFMFNGCSKLTSLDLSNFNTSNVTDMGYMFNDCSGLTSLDLSNFNTSNVTDMNNMFRSCSDLTSLDLSNFNTSNVTDMNYMFYGCSALETLDYSLTGFEVNGIVPDLSVCTNLKTLRLHHATPSYVNNFIELAKVPSTCNVIQVS